MLGKTINKLFKTGFFHIFGSSIVNKLISFASNMILVRILSKVDYGVYTYAFNIVSLLLIASGLGIPSGLLQLLSEIGTDKDKADKIYSCGSGIALRFNVLLMLCIIIIGVFVPLKIDGANGYLLWMSLIPICDMAFTLQTTYMRSLLMTQKYAYSNNINSCAICGFSIIGALFAGAKGLIIGRYIANLFTILIVWKLFDTPVRFRKVQGENIQNIKELVNISIVSAANNGISQLLYLLDIFIIGIVISDQSVIASYKVATTIPTALTFVPLAVITYVYPYFALHREEKQWVKGHYIKLVTAMGIMNLLIAIPAIIFAPLIVRICFGNKYLDAVLIFRVLMLNYFISGTFRIISGNLLVTQRELKFNLMVSVISGIVNIIGNIILISRFGAIGATITTVLVVVISSIISTAKFYSNIKE
ncbi:oligosaccharide flippase family protein [uncultured Clostridium sp.]|uniref:oligosaccharide flippase family protein n=1 Tax=uncultured Clostridium sp. TaxID=59620 RepID=UPI0025F7543A|nr:oligosaccharide flippase family protein [uncultured Clostridium sp.]